tara:strand:+ start:655 stop:1407 length:753 start_codon:yes stop_codon:yes gene_type:complete
MLRLQLTRGSSGILTQSFSEVCEHCDEKVQDVDIADIITQKPNDPRTLKIRDKDNNLYTLKTKGVRVAEIEAKARAKDLLDASGEKLKYKIRAERMCSESIDTVNGTTASFCYRTTNTKFLDKKINGTSISASFHNGIESDVTGSKMGVDRKGNVIRLKAYKRINMTTGIVIDAERDTKYEGPYKTAWWRAIRTESDRKYLILGSQAVAAYVDRYGSQVKDMTVVARYRGRAEFVADVNRNVARGETSLR